MLMLLCILFQLQYNSINIYLNMVVIHFLLETIFTDCCLSFCPFFLLVIVLSVLLRYTDYDCPLGIFWSLCCLSFFDIRIMIAPWVSFGHCVICSSSIYEY
jgi:hypothetical protein